MTWAALRAQILAWEADPASAVEDPGRDVPPSPGALRAARALVDQGEREGSWPPTWVIPDSEGGLAFELHGNRALWVARVGEDGSVEVEEFGRSGVLQRVRLRWTYVSQTAFRWPELRIEWTP